MNQPPATAPGNPTLGVQGDQRPAAAPGQGPIPMAGPAAPAGPAINMRPPVKPASLRSRLLTIAFVALAFAPLVVIVSTHSDYFKRAAGYLGVLDIRTPTAGSVGDGRFTVLDQISRNYQGPGADDLRAKGHFAPVEYLNRSLERRKIKWRVRSVDGRTAEIYEIS